MSGASGAVLAGACAGLALLLSTPDAPVRLRSVALPRRAGRGAGAPRAGPRTAAARAGPAGEVLGAACLVALAGLLGPVTGGPGGALLLLVPAGLLGWRARVRSRRDAARTRRRRGAVAEAAQVVSAELRAGRTPREALGEAARVSPELAPPAAAAAVGADVVLALRAAAAAPGAEALAVLAAGWEVTERTGAPLAVLTASVAQHLRDEDAALREVGAELASVRTTGRLLALLPLATLALGAGLGGDPWQVLVGTPWGAACGLAGAGLAVTGLVWVARIAAGGARSPWVP